MGEANEDFRRLLRKLGWTNSRAAMELGYSPGAITQILDGSTTPRPVALKLLKAAAGELIIGARQETAGQAITTEEQELLAGLRAMKPEVRHAMIAALKAATPRTENPIKSRVPSIDDSIGDALHETAEPAAPPPAASKPPVHVSYRTHPIMTEHQRRMARKAAAREENERLTAEAAAALAESLPHAMKAAGLNQASQPSPAVPEPIAGKPRPSAGKSPHPKVQQ